MASGFYRLTKEGKAFYAEMDKLKKLVGCVGFVGGGESGGGQAISPEDYEGGATVAQVAAWNEYGTEHIPPRPFMLDSFTNSEKGLTAFGQNQLNLVATGKQTAEGALKALCAYHVGNIQKEILDGDFKANAPATIRQKKSDKPLIDTSHMMQSVHYVLKPR